jgi:hypothetical protein
MMYSGTVFRSENNSPNGDIHRRIANAAAKAGRRAGLWTKRYTLRATPSSATPVLEAERIRATRNSKYTAI